MLEKILYPELSYSIVGILFDVYNELGGDYQEKYYQRAVASALRLKKINFVEQLPVLLEYQESKIGRYYLDFLIDGKIILEIKRGDYFSRTNIRQLYTYLRATKLNLGIIANFTTKGVKFKRIVNIK